MPNYSRTKGAIVASDGFYRGSKGSETLVISSAGVVLAQEAIGVSFTTASTAQTVYTVSPCNGNVTAVYVTIDTATITTGYTVKVGSAGDTIASVTNSSGSAGTTSTMTLGTVAVTAGQSISVARAAQGTAGGSYVTIVLNRTS